MRIVAFKMDYHEARKMVTEQKSPITHTFSYTHDFTLSLQDQQLIALLVQVVFLSYSDNSVLQTIICKFSWRAIEGNGRAAYHGVSKEMNFNRYLF